MHTIGRRPAIEEPSELLRGCHEKIRRFLGLADRLASDEPATDDDVRGTAAAVSRYFTEALPLHERDEDEAIAPRLAGTSAAVDRTLAEMHAQHEAMHPLVDALIAVCDRIAAAPTADAQVARAIERDELHRVLAQLAPRMAAHLAAEEGLIFPLLDELSFAERAALTGEMRARRVPIP
jgi:pyridoxamine 5'-phosphate oxidase